MPQPARLSANDIVRLEALLDQYPCLRGRIVLDVLLVVGQQLQMGVDPSVLIMRLRQPNFAVIPRGSHWCEEKENYHDD